MRVLVAPMDWGLGHATRCIPIVAMLLNKSCEVILGGSGLSLALLQREFPQLSTVALPAYNPRYAKGKNLAPVLLMQLPHFINTIQREHSIVEEVVATHNIDIIISDNRFGCWSRRAKSVFMTHQINIIMPSLLSWFAPIINFFNHRQIIKFDVCWVPDEEGSASFAGKLSAAAFPAQYIGILSQLRPTQHCDIRYDVFVILSGPEPQRTLLEEKIYASLKNFNGTLLMVRGVRGNENIRAVSRNFFVADCFGRAAMQQAVNQSKLIIARSGYTTVMDMATAGKHVVFIPTPGQTEQAYLAERLKEKGVAYRMVQNSFNLIDALNGADAYTGFSPWPHNDRLERAINNLVT